jgi:hypothetical protein
MSLDSYSRGSLLPKETYDMAKFGLLVAESPGFIVVGLVERSASIEDNKIIIVKITTYIEVRTCLRRLLI